MSVDLRTAIKYLNKTLKMHVEASQPPDVVNLCIALKSVVDSLERLEKRVLEIDNHLVEVLPLAKSRGRIRVRKRAMK